MGEAEFTILSRGSQTDDRGLTVRTCKVEQLEAGEKRLGAAFAPVLRSVVERSDVEADVRGQALLRLVELQGSEAVDVAASLCRSGAPDPLAANAVVALLRAEPTDLEARLGAALLALGLDQPLALRNLLAAWQDHGRPADPEPSCGRLAEIADAEAVDHYVRGRALTLLATWNGPGWLERVESQLTAGGRLDEAWRAFATGVHALPRERALETLRKAYAASERRKQSGILTYAEELGFSSGDIHSAFASEGGTPSPGEAGLREELRAAGLNADALRVLGTIDGQEILGLDVPQAEALKAWEIAREGVRSGYPVLLDDMPFHEYEPDPVEEILRVAETWGTDEWTALQRKRLREDLAKLKELNAPNVILEEYERRIAGEEGAVEDPGPWPDATPSPRPLHLPEGSLLLAFLPCSDGGAAIAWLKFGGFNDCPPPQEHVARLRDWEQRFGAELVAATQDSLSLRVLRTPQGRDEALALAREHARYNPCDSDGLAVDAAGLIDRPHWFFWWD